MAKSRKLPSGRWNCCVYSHTDTNGKKHFASFTADTKAEAQRQALEFQINRKKEDKPQNVTVGEAIDKYITTKSNVLSPSTLKEYKNYSKYYTNLANIRVGSLTSVDLQEFVNELSIGKNPKTVRNIYSLLLSSIRLYSERNFRVTLPQKQTIERHIPVDADIRNLIQKSNPSLKLAIILGSKGFRRGEICGLKYGDILRDFNAIYIHRDMILTENGWYLKEMPKTDKSVRRVRLPKEVIEMLGDGDEDEFILKVKPSTITSDFINLRNKLGLQCRFHDLRHYSASIMHSLNIPDVYIMEQHGWKSDTVLKSVYRNSLSDKSDTFTTLANDYFSKNIMSENRMDSDFRTKFE